MKRNPERFHKLLSDAVTLFCKEEISYSKSLHVTGTINISVDQDIVYKATIDRNYAYSTDGRSVVYERKLVNGGIQVLEGGLRTPAKQMLPELRSLQLMTTPPSNAPAQRPNSIPSRFNKERRTGFSPGSKVLPIRPQKLPRFSSEGRGTVSPRSKVPFFHSQNFSPRCTANSIRNVSCSPNVNHIRNVRQPIQNSPRHPVSPYQQQANRAQHTEINSLQNRLKTEISVQCDVVEIDSDTEVCEYNEVMGSEINCAGDILLPRNSVDSGYAASTNVETDMPLSHQPNKTLHHVDANISQQPIRVLNYPVNLEKEVFVTLSSDEASDTSVESEDEIINDHIKQETPAAEPLKISDVSASTGVSVYNSSSISAHYSSGGGASNSSVVSAKNSSNVSVHNSQGVTAKNSSGVSAQNSLGVSAYNSSSVSSHNSSSISGHTSMDMNAQNSAVVNVLDPHNNAVKSETVNLDNSIACDNLDELKHDNVSDLTENINRVQAASCVNLTENIEPATSASLISNSTYDIATDFAYDSTINDPCPSTIGETWESTIGSTFDNIFGETCGGTIIKDCALNSISGNINAATKITVSDLLTAKPTASTSTETDSKTPCDSGDGEELSKHIGNGEYSGPRRKTLSFLGERKTFEDGDIFEDLEEDSDERLSDPEYLPTDESNESDEYHHDEEVGDCDGHKVSQSHKKRRMNEGTPRKSHDVVGEFICKYDGCGKMFSLKGNLTRHQRAVHGRRFGDSFSATFECHLSNCRKKFATINALKRHMKALHGCDAGQLEQSIL